MSSRMSLIHGVIVTLSECVRDVVLVSGSNDLMTAFVPAIGEMRPCPLQIRIVSELAIGRSLAAIIFWSVPLVA